MATEFDFDGSFYWFYYLLNLYPPPAFGGIPIDYLAGTKS
jgi:hypothetical protein